MKPESSTQDLPETERPAPQVAEKPKQDAPKVNPVIQAATAQDPSPFSAAAYATSPLTLAAYQVLLERDLPMNCKTEERRQEILRQWDDTLAWASSLFADEKKAYTAAIAQLKQELDEHMRRLEADAANSEAFESITRPPAIKQWDDEVNAPIA